MDCGQNKLWFIEVRVVVNVDECGRVLVRYVHNRFCNKVVFEKIMLKIDYKWVLLLL